MVYLPRHAGSVLTSGQVLAGPTTVANILSHLRMIFKELGRGQQWESSGQTGNSAAAHELKQWGQGYTKVCQTSGFRITAAKPMTEAKVKDLLSYLSSAAFKPSNKVAFDRALLARDGFAFCLLWQTGLRGINASDSVLEDFIIPGPGRGSIRAYLCSQQPMQLQHPGTIEVHPLRTKTSAQNTGRVHVEPSDTPVLDLWFWPVAAYTSAFLARQPITQYLVRATESSAGSPAIMPDSRGLQFADRQLSRSGLHDRLKKHLTHISAYEGESMHSFRRGSSQFKLITGQSKAAIKQGMLIKSSDILELYLAAGRNNSGIKRLCTAAGQALAAMPTTSSTVQFRHATSMHIAAWYWRSVGTLQMTARPPLLHTALHSSPGSPPYVASGPGCSWKVSTPQSFCGTRADHNILQVIRRKPPSHTRVHAAPSNSCLGKTSKAALSRGHCGLLHSCL